MRAVPKFTFGVGDRFGQSAAAQLQSFIRAKAAGVDLVPVWNKSNREHLIVGSDPSATRAAADRAVKDLGWEAEYLLDADHINCSTVDRYIPHCDFFTLDVADSIGEPAESGAIEAFVDRHSELIGQFGIRRDDVERTAKQFLGATQKAGEIYRHIVAQKGGEDDFVTEVSMDETDNPQSPAEILIILAALADEKIPVQTFAPKFTGRFNKGVDYDGDLAQFEKEFDANLVAIARAIETYGLPSSLKLSVHSGSDKFSLYPIIKRAVKRTGAGIHLKTAGTHWLEEVIGLADAGGSGLELAKEIYAQALARREALCEPYATVIDIDSAKLPTSETVAGWNSTQFTGALRHDQSNPAYNPHLRQLLHVGFKIAAQLGDTYTAALHENAETVARNVGENLYDRHIVPLFID
ncbi:MAG: hypothetical protein KDN22_27160 [Verrucomicrobiae bacterium]|nr:hypothetical protein [Verrucomicrobiae bacterium]